MILVCLVGVLSASSAAASPGDLDPTFGDAGVFIGPEDSNITSIGRLVPETDGGFLALGEGPRFGSYGSVLAKLQPSGEFEPTFGWDGHAPSNLDPAEEVFRLPDGSVALAGMYYSDNRRLGEFAVERFHAEGDPDSSFGWGGRATVRVGSEEPSPPTRAYFDAAALDAQGRVVHAGFTYGGEGTFRVFVRQLPDGRPDPSFGDGGVVRFGRGPLAKLTTTHLQPLPDGGLVVSGALGYPAVPALVRLRPDGSPERRFSRDGIAIPDDQGSLYVSEPMADGSIVAVGCCSQARPGSLLVSRFLSDGRPARLPAPGRVDRADVPPGGGPSSAFITRQPDDKFVTVASSYVCEERGPCESRATIRRYLASGKLDREFGTEGRVTPPLGDSTGPSQYGHFTVRDEAHVVLSLPDERLLIAGGALRRRPMERGGLRQEYMLARFEDTVAPRHTSAFPGRLRVRHGRTVARLGCTEAGPACAGRLVIRKTLVSRGRRATVRLVNRLFQLTPGRPERVGFALGRRGRALLSARGRLRVRVVVRLRDANGNSLTRTRRVMLVRARSKASASGSAPARFFGMHADQAFEQQGDQRAATLAAVRATGAGVVRQQLAWSRVEREPGVYDWSEFDAYVEAVARADLDLLPILIEPPAFRSRAPAGPQRGLYAPRRWRAFAAFAALAVARYGPTGSFWADHPDVPRRPIRDWQVWNEPSLAYFWRPRPHAHAFGSMLRVVAAAIRRADPGARVIAPALPESSYGVPLMKYLERMSRAAGRRGYDVAAVNPYARTVGEMMRLLRRTRRWLDRHGRRRVPISVSEFGWASFDERDAWTQAEKVATAVHRLARERRRLRLSGALHYSWQDADPFPGGADFWGIHTGLFDRGGRPKPALEAFRREVTRAMR